MARVTYGVAITELQGSIGGVTFQRNASGAIAKRRSNPTVNPTALQAFYQTRMATLVSLWPTLSQADKDTWDAFALANDHTTPWGETKTLSGYQWFLSCNLNRLLYHSTARHTAPGWIVPAPPPQFIIETSPTYIRCAWTPNWNGISAFFYASLPLRQSSLKLRRSLFLIRVYFDIPSIANLDLTSEIETLFNVTWADFYASANCNILIRVRNGYFDRGLLSSYTSAIIKVS